MPQRGPVLFYYQYSFKTGLAQNMMAKMSNSRLQKIYMCLAISGNLGYMKGSLF